MWRRYLPSSGCRPEAPELGWPHRSECVDLSPRCRCGGRSVALPGTCDRCDKPDFLSPGLSQMPPDPPNSHIHTRADLVPCVSMSPATLRTAMYSCAGCALPNHILPRQQWLWKSSSHCHQSPAPLGWHLPSGGAFSSSHKGILWANSSLWHWRGEVHSLPWYKGSSAVLYSLVTFLLPCGSSPPGPRLQKL